MAADLQGYVAFVTVYPGEHQQLANRTVVARKSINSFAHYGGTYDDFGGHTFCWR